MLDKIKVGGMTYDVVLKDLSTNNDEENGSMHVGFCVYHDNEIEINNKISKQRQEQTLVHEMVHAIFCEVGLNVENEEDIVNRVSLMLHQVLKDNDFSWLRDDDDVETHTWVAGDKGYLMDANGEMTEVDFK